MKLLVLEFEILITNKQYKELFESEHTYRRTIKLIKKIFRGDVALRDSLVVPTKHKRRVRKHG